MRTYLTLLALLVNLSLASAQLSVGSSGMSILAGTPLSVDGLTLTPSTLFTLTNNTIQRTNTPLAGNPSIGRLYQFSAPVLFSGTINIHYLPAELNGYPESRLQVAYAPAANTNLIVTTKSMVNTVTHSVSNTLTNQNLYLVTATVLSDLAPIMYARPSVVRSNSPFTVVVDVVELDSVATNDLFKVYVTKDQSINLTLDAGLTEVDGRPVQNSVWSFDNSNPYYYVLTTSQRVAADDQLSFGLTGTISPGASSGILTVSSVINSTNVREAKGNNNSDSDMVEYKQQ